MPNRYSQDDPRPRWNDPRVRESVLADLLPEIQNWVLSEGVLDEDAPELFRDVPAVLCVALLDSPDAYSAARYLEEIAGFPVDTYVVLKLADAFRQMERNVPQFEREWVIATGIRINAREDDRITFRLGDMTLTGVVRAVNRGEARAYVELKTGASGAKDRKVRLISVNAEDVIEINPAPARSTSTSKAND